MSRILKDFIQCKPVDEVSVRIELERVLNELQAYRAALSHHATNSSNYIRKIKENIEIDVITQEGELLEIEQTRMLPWSVIKDVLIHAQKLAERLKNPLA